MAEATPADPRGEGAAPATTMDLLAAEDRLVEAAGRDGLRRHTARGTVINTVFRIGMAGFSFVAQLVVAAFLTASQFGAWGVILGTLLLAQFIRYAGVQDKFVQQSDEDQEDAFQQYFTIELLIGVVAMALTAAAFPLFGLIYGRSEIILPGIVLTLAILGTALQAPNAVFYRRMDFVRQRLLEAVPTVTTGALGVALAVAGAGYWSLVISAVVGALIGAAASIRMSPYRPALRLQRGTLRSYFGFSWPLVVERGSGLAAGNAALLIATRTAGFAATGAIGLGSIIVQLSRGVDAIVTETLYPAVCAVRHRRDLLGEAFGKSNRLALMWGAPFGVAVVLFGPDLVHYVIGNHWKHAIIVLQASGIVAVVDQVGFNWTAFLRALDHTRPLAILAVLNLIAFFMITAPLLAVFGLNGFAAGLLAGEAIVIAARTYFLLRLFPDFPMLRQAARAIAPTLPAIACVLLARAFEGDRNLAVAVAELSIFCVVILGATALLERRLLREVLGYLKGGGGGGSALRLLVGSGSR